MCKVTGPPFVTPSCVPLGPDGRWVRRAQLEMARPRNRGRKLYVGCRHQCVKHKIHIVSQTRTLCMPIAPARPVFLCLDRAVSSQQLPRSRVKACSCQTPARHRCHPCGCKQKPSLQAQQKPTLTGATSDIQSDPPALCALRSIGSSDTPVLCALRSFLSS